MKTMAISEVKVKCLSILKEIEQTQEPLMVTLRGKPLVTIEPIRKTPRKKILGAMAGTMKIEEGLDLVHYDWSKDWEMLHNHRESS